MSTFRSLLMSGGQTPPPEYTVVQWIQSNKQQYIDLGDMGTNGVYSLSVDMLLPSSTNSGTSMFGARNDSPSTRRIGTMYFPGALQSGLWVGTSTSLLLTTHQHNTRFRLRADVDESTHTVTMDYNGAVSSAKFNGTTSTGLGLFLFGANLNGNIVERGIFRVYGVRVDVDRVFKRELVPVLDSNGIPMLYDLASRTSFPNKGTGQFTYG